MKRAIVQPADVSGVPLEELKQWLGITRDAENQQLIGLLQASLEWCEAYTGQTPLEVSCEEVFPAQNAWQKLSATPVRAITGVDKIVQDNARITLFASAYEMEIDSAASGSVRLLQPVSSNAIVVSYIAGIASDWSGVPAGMRHGIIRLAAHHYLTRDKSDDGAVPASVTALWRPWKKVRL
ncbi:hypothetical protein BPTFM16_01951 [Altererythrobacter insulae]|nr:hypothetical protein BPTFM16_01951 [Altererythrobacter insulae]